MQTISSYRIKSELYKATYDGKLHQAKQVYGLTEKVVSQIEAVEGVTDVDVNGVEQSNEYDPVRHVLPHDHWQLDVETVRGKFTAEICVMWGDDKRATYFDYTVMFWKAEA